MEVDQMAAIDNASPEELEQMLSVPTEESEPETTEPGTSESEAKPVEPPTPDKFKELEERMAKYEKQLKDKEAFINQRNQEIGNLRKQLLDKRAAELAEDVEPSEEEILKDPKAAVRKAIERAKEREELDKQRQMDAEHTAIEQTKQVLINLVPTFEQDKPAMLEVMRADGADAKLIEQFDQNPTSLHPAIVYQLQKRAEMYRELQALKEKLNGEPKKLADNLAKFGNAKSPTTQAPASKPKSKRLDSLTESDINKMSLEELNELQKEL